ncbi:MAG: hypothetical protein SNJ64_00855 [Endomicrobiia bacterium]
MTETNMTTTITRKFLEELDRYLKENLNNITCKDIYNLYCQFLLELKEFKGNATGFTGLSEYLIYRFLYNLNVQKNVFQIGQNSRVIVAGKRYYPDIVIYKKTDELMAVIQIKIYITGGHKELKDEIEKLKDIQNHYSEIQALFVIFNDQPKGGRILSLLEETKNNMQWFDFLILENNKTLLKNILEEWIVANEG